MAKANNSQSKGKKKNQVGLIVLIVMLVILGGIGFGIYKACTFFTASFATRDAGKFGAFLKQESNSLFNGGSSETEGNFVIESESDYLTALQTKAPLDCRINDLENGPMLLKTDAGFTRMRSQIVSGELTINSLIIDDTVYSWNEGEITGIKMIVTTEFKENAVKVAVDYFNEEGSEEDLAATPDLDCATPTGLSFDLPANIEFTDYSALFKDLGIDLGS